MTDTPTTPDTADRAAHAAVPADIRRGLREFVDADGGRWFEVRPGWVVYAPTRAVANARSVEVGPHHGWALSAAHEVYELRAIGDTDGQPDSITTEED